MSASPGWYPQGDGSLRFWDGSAWTEHRASAAPPAQPTGPRRGPAAAERKSSWIKTRTAVGIGSGLLGLFIGVGIGMSDTTTDDADALKTKIATLKDDNLALKQDVTEAKADVEDAQAVAIDPEDVQAQIDDAVKEARAKAAYTQRKKDALALKKAVAKEKAKNAAKIRSLTSQVSASSSSGSGSSSGGGVDPRFGTCGEANDNGYGPYRQGADPEYDWYTDRDGDGVVCES